LLGSVSPSLVKYAVRSLDENGKIVGELNALNTIGSIIGTFTPTFITIPLVGTSWTFIIFAFILLAIAMTYFISAGVKRVKIFVLCALAVGFSVLASIDSFAFWRFGENIYEDESIYNYLQVVEDEDDVFTISGSSLIAKATVGGKYKAKIRVRASYGGLSAEKEVVPRIS